MVDMDSQMFGFDAPFSAILVGTSGGIGNALLEEAIKAVAANTVDASGHVFAINRKKQPSEYPAVTSLTADALNEEQLAETVATIKGSLQQNKFAPIRLILVAVGSLHTSQGTGPEKSLRSVTAHSMQEIFAANTVAPALAAKHFLPLLPKSGRTIFAALSARVGSISDNQLGGWYSYRASKSALNQILKTASIELSRTRPEAICVGLHPGTVDTKLSKPFQANVPDGKLFSAEQSANYLVQTLSRLTAEHSGQVFAWDGTPVPA
ncbi:SDR family NAD(P)-dependent oxidoreductase [Pararhizobium sp. IMCC21322]|uniref:SDR family NAD(P)-dependent oxidoreductase n=1 Tax=Pararhizobium sp. IMCC21322 TaxID=3067903 RepID=UPI002741719D|nr:SDR family NAD(P)-dependent oxidoreductase [Pararhizobium sp. IMCC21322]